MRAGHSHIPVSAAPVVMRVFLPFAAGYFLSYLHRSIPAVIAPDLVNEFELDAADLGLLTSLYLLPFALFQLPLGMLLDRFAPRRVESLLLLFAASGALVFASSAGLGGLLIGRALIGLGVSACLMAAFKSFVIWFPPERLPSVNGAIMAAGGLGALTATAPVEAALQITTWRGVFVGLATVTLLVAAMIFLLVPDRRGDATDSSLSGQLRGLGHVFTSRRFWQIAPLTTCTASTFIATQTLWVGPWLSDVAGLDRQGVANHLSLMALAMVAGYLLIGHFGYWFSRRGVPPIVVVSANIAVFLLVQFLLVAGFAGAPRLQWIAYGFFGSAGIVYYAVLSQSFPAGLSGRANAALNLLVFGGAFAVQWGMGVVINLWPVATGYAPQGYQTAFGVMLALQVLAFGWLLIGARRAVAGLEELN